MAPPIMAPIKRVGANMPPGVPLTNDALVVRILAIPRTARSVTPGTIAFQRGADLGSWSGLARTGGGALFIIVGSSKTIPMDQIRAIGTEVMRTISRSFARTIVTANVSNATRVDTTAHARATGTTGTTGR